MDTCPSTLVYNNNSALQKFKQKKERKKYKVFYFL